MQYGEWAAQHYLGKENPFSQDYFGRELLQLSYWQEQGKKTQVHKTIALRASPAVINPGKSSGSSSLPFFYSTFLLLLQCWRATGGGANLWPPIGGTLKLNQLTQVGAIAVTPGSDEPGLGHRMLPPRN